MENSVLYKINFKQNWYLQFGGAFLRTTPHLFFVVVQPLSCVRLFVTPWTAACQAPVLHYLLGFAQTHVH